MESYNLYENVGPRPCAEDGDDIWMGWLKKLLAEHTRLVSLRHQNLPGHSVAVLLLSTLVVTAAIEEAVKVLEVGEKDNGDVPHSSGTSIIFFGALVMLVGVGVKWWVKRR